MITGADLESLCVEAVMACLREDINGSIVKPEHFEMAMNYCRRRLLTEGPTFQL